MGSLYRSEDMVLCQMYIQADAAYSCVSQLGELGIVQFKDLNADVNMFKRKFVSEVRRCEEMERQIRYFECEMAKHRVVAADSGSEHGTPASRDIVDLAATFESMEAELKELNNNVESLERNYVEMQELMYVLHCTDPFFGHMSFREGMSEARSEVETSFSNSPSLGARPYDRELHDVGSVDTTTSARLRLRYMAGVIPVARFSGFSRMMWFATHGNAFLRHVEIVKPVKDPHTAEFVRKAVFLAIFPGEHFMDRVRKICEGFKATIYACPDKAEERNEMKQNLRTKMRDLEVVLNMSIELRARKLEKVASNINAWSIKTSKLKAVYMIMNMFHAEGQNYLAEGWLPHAELGTVQAVLSRASELTGNRVSSLLHPIVADTMPTYHKVNKFTRAFQAIIDAYGVASYKEVNPAPFSIITFPFLFAVMFGDAGHGLLMLGFAIFMIVRERHLVKTAANNEMFGMIYHGRYIILLMSLFTIYAGFIYNDFFSKPLNIFGSSWSGKCMPESPTSNGVHVSEKWQLNPSNKACYTGEPYVFGIDPLWQISENKIAFTNSFKKKIAVIFGVCHMLFGVVLSLCNHWYFRRRLDILTVFIPRLLFLMAIFGYLCGLIFAKWLLPVNYLEPFNYYYCSPNLLIGFIGMFLNNYPTYDGTNDEFCSSWTWYPGQRVVQTSLLIVAAISAVWMLLSQPLILLCRHKFGQHARLVEESNSATSLENLAAGSGESVVDIDMDDQLLTDVNIVTPANEGSRHPMTIPAPAKENFDPSEVALNQIIHTIEFCLGCVSHVASYLRLWALSLAHAQLSEVLWSMLLRDTFSNRKSGTYFRFLPILISFTTFMALTVVLLIVIEGLSAFLHTLRLHWVEFNSKFYHGEGMPFVPFSFDEILRARERQKMLNDEIQRAKGRNMSPISEGQLDAEVEMGMAVANIFLSFVR